MNTTTRRAVSTYLTALAANGMPFAAAAKEKPPKVRQYLAHNLWYKSRAEISSALYQSGTMLPAGTEVEKVEVVGQSNYFDLAGGRKGVGVYWVQRHRCGADVKAFFEKPITPKDFEAPTRGFTSDEFEAIEAGVIKPGMSKSAVLEAAGAPPRARRPPPTPTYGNTGARRA